MLSLDISKKLQIFGIIFLTIITIFLWVLARNKHTREYRQSLLQEQQNENLTGTNDYWNENDNVVPITWEHYQEEFLRYLEDGILLSEGILETMTKEDMVIKVTEETMAKRIAFKELIKSIITTNTETIQHLKQITSSDHL